MSYIIRRTRVLVGSADLEPRPPEREHIGTGEATLAFYRAPSEGLRYPGDVVALLDAEGIEIGTLRARNPAPHDQWWIPVVGLAKASVPYAIALGAVIRTWLKERKGRQIKFQLGSMKITANTPEDVERLITAATKHQKKIGPLHVTGAKGPAKRTPAKKATKKNPK